MADFIPSTTQEGQGGAQILSSNIQYANAGGVVRGIERGVDAMKEEQKYQREIDRAKAIEKKKSIDKLNEQITSIQVPAFTTLAEDEFKGFWDKVYSGESKDWQSDFQKTYSNIMKYVNASNDFVAGRDNLANSNFYNEYDGVFINGMVRGSGLMNTEPPQDMLEARNEGGADAVVGLFYNNYSSSSPNIYDTEPSDFGKVLQDYLDAKMKIYGEEDSKLKDLDGKIGVNTTRGFNDETQEKIRQDLLLNKEMRLRFLKASGQPYKHMTEEKMQELWSDAVGQMRMPQTNKMSGFTNDGKDKKGKGDNNNNSEDDVDSDLNVFEINLNEDRGETVGAVGTPSKPVVEIEDGGNTILGKIKGVYVNSNGETRALVSVGVKSKSDDNLTGIREERAVDIDAVSAQLKGDNLKELERAIKKAQYQKPTIVISEDEISEFNSEIKSLSEGSSNKPNYAKFLAEKWLGLTGDDITDPSGFDDISFTYDNKKVSLDLGEKSGRDELLKLIKDYRVKNNMQSVRFVEPDAVYYVLEGRKLSLNVIDRAYGGKVPQGAEKVTKKNQKMIEANLPDSSREDEGQNNTPQAEGNPEIGSASDLP